MQQMCMIRNTPLRLILGMNRLQKQVQATGMLSSLISLESSSVSMDIVEREVDKRHKDDTQKSFQKR